MSYDKNNIFAKILRGEIPCKKIYEEAKKYYGECLEMRRRLFGKDTQNPQIAQTHWNIFGVYNEILRTTPSRDTTTRQTNLREATRHCKKALEIYDKAYAYEVCHPHTLSVADGYFYFLDAAKNYEALVTFSEDRLQLLRTGQTELNRASAVQKWRRNLTIARTKLRRWRRRGHRRDPFWNI